jgi:hypothetical protein
MKPFLSLSYLISYHIIKKGDMTSNLMKIKLPNGRTAVLNMLGVKCSLIYLLRKRAWLHTVKVNFTSSARNMEKRKHILKGCLTVKYVMGCNVRLFPMEDFILFFPCMTCHQKCFETTNETTSKIHDLILEFHNTKFYFILLIVYEMK